LRLGRMSDSNANLFKGEADIMF